MSAYNLPLDVKKRMGARESAVMYRQALEAGWDTGHVFVEHGQYRDQLEAEHRADQEALDLP